MLATVTDIDAQQQAVAHRWQITTHRLVEARNRFRVLTEAESMDIRELRRTARMVYDLELECGALASAMETFHG
jgi:hypothetical protein